MQEMMISICVTIAEFAPDHGLGVLIPDLLGDTGSWDTVKIGLKALYRVILNAPGRLHPKGSINKVGPHVRKILALLLSSCSTICRRDIEGE